MALLKAPVEFRLIPPVPVWGFDWVTAVLKIIAYEEIEAFTREVGVEIQASLRVSIL